MFKSILGSSATFFLYIRWIETLNIVALIVAIASGLATLGYTIYKWNKEYKKNDK